MQDLKHQTEWIPVEAQESGYMCQIAHESRRSIRLSISVAGLSEKKCVELHHVCESRCFTISWFFFHHFHYHHDQQQQYVDLMKLLSQVHILICCGQIISMSSELCSNSKQAPPSPRWSRDEICVGLNHPSNPHPNENMSPSLEQHTNTWWIDMIRKRNW